MIAIYSKTFDERCAHVIRKLLKILAQADVDVLLHQPLCDFLNSLPEPAHHIAGVFREKDGGSSGF